MHTFYLFAGVMLLLSGCQNGNGSDVQPFNAPVQSLADLPTTYLPIQNGSVVAGRLKSQTYAGELNGEWRYNQQGNVVEGRHFRLGQIASADQYRYDVTGRLRYVQHFDNECGFSSLSTCSGPVKWTSYNEFDTDNVGRIKESRTFLQQSGQWQLRSIVTYEYDSQNQPVKVLWYDAARKLGKTQEFSYDGKGNISSLREISTVSSPEFADRTFHYDYDKGLNPYAGTVYYVSAFFSSRHMQFTAGATYEFAATGYPIRIYENNVVTELSYY